MLLCDMTHPFQFAFRGYLANPKSLTQRSPLTIPTVDCPNSERLVDRFIEVPFHTSQSNSSLSGAMADLVVKYLGNRQHP